jgi:hypothetical protein
MTTKYTNYDIIITNEGQDPQQLKDINLSISNPKISLDVLFDIIRNADNIEARAWAPKAQASGLNAQLLGSAEADPVVPF